MSSPSEEQSSTPSSPTPSAHAVARRVPQWKWNPYADHPLPSLLTSGQVAEEAKTIPALMERYEQQVTALVNNHEEIMFVKEKIEEAVNQLRSHAATLVSPNDDQSLFELKEQSKVYEILQQGLDIRLRQFAEDCQSASKLEWLLRRKISATEEDSEESTHVIKPFEVQPTCEVIKKVRDQDRLIKLLQHVIDQNLYRNHVFADRLRRMRKQYFAEELPSWGAMEEDSSWFRGEQIRFKADDSSQTVSSWMHLIRTHPAPETVPPPPRADPQSLHFVARMHDIEQLASAVANKGPQLSRFSRQRELKELQDQLSKLREVLTGAAAAAAGIEKAALETVTTQADEQTKYTPHAVPQRRRDTGERREAPIGDEKSDTVGAAKALASETIVEGAKIPGAAHAESGTLERSREKHEATSGVGTHRMRSKSALRKSTSVISVSGIDVLPETAIATLPSPRQSRSSILDLEMKESKFVKAASQKGGLDSRKQSFSASRAAPPSLLRGVSRTVPSPRQSFHEERESQSGDVQTARSLTDEGFLPTVQPSRGVVQSRDEIRRDTRTRVTKGSFAQMDSIISRAGSRVVPSPLRTLSRDSLAPRSPRDSLPRVMSTPLSRAMSSAFLGGEQRV